MGHTFTRLLTHAIFATAGRLPAITPTMQSDVHAYCGGIVRELGGVAIAIGGTSDHLHALLQLRSELNIADVLRVAKTNSSRWIHEKWPEQHRFAWQRGYGAFTVSASDAECVDSLYCQSA